MKKIAKSITAFSIIAVIAVSFSGCQKSGNTSSDTNVTENGEVIDTETQEIRQNDYRGGITRTKALQTSVLKIMEDMKANNTVIRQDSPNSFWTADGYQDFVSTFLDIGIIDDTQWFNEEESDWDTVISSISSVSNDFTSESDGAYALKSGISIVRNEKDDYSVNNVPCTVYIRQEDNYTGYDVNADYRILYDCDKDWCKAYATAKISNELAASTIELFEYQRVSDDIFIIQTSRERLMVVLAPTEGDTDIRNREVKEFYYSKLVSEGQRTTYEPYELLPETNSVDNITISENVTMNELYADYPFLNSKGDICDRYGESDSMFYRSPKEIDSSWAFEDKALQQGIAYKDGVLVVTTYNKLSENYERFIYAKADSDESTVKELENLVEIKNLVGVQEAETTAVSEEAVETTENGTTEESTTEESENTEVTETPENTETSDKSEESSEVQDESE